MSSWSTGRRRSRPRPPSTRPEDGFAPRAPAMPEPLLRISRLTKKYGEATVVDDLSLEIMAGECLGVIGPNGAGKTTTIRICLGLSGADDGTIEAFGMPLPERVRDAKKGIG